MNHPEFVLFAHPTDPDSLDYLVREGFTSEKNRECIPTPLARDIVGWVLTQYFKAGRKVAPTREGILATWGDEMEKQDLQLDDSQETDSVEWAVEELRSNFAVKQAQDLTTKTVNDIFNAAPPEKVAMVREAAKGFYALAQQLSSHHQEVALDDGFDAAWARYQERAVARQTVSGMTFDLPEIDEYTMGIRPSELAVFAAGSGAGKSWFGCKVCLGEWKRGRQNVFVSLEMTVEEVIDRMACMVAGISYDRWQRGRVDVGGLKRFQLARQRLKDTEHSPIIVTPEDGDRDPVSLVQRALSLGGESLIIDQLSHIERPPGSRARERHQIVADIVRALASEIKGREALPCLLLAQIKRKGKEDSRKTGRYEMEDLAESAEIERTAHWVFSVIRQPKEENEDLALLQMLKGRRVEARNWEMIWRLGVGDIRVAREVEDLV